MTNMVKRKKMAKRKFREIAYMLLSFAKLGGLQLSQVTINWV